MSNPRGSDPPSPEHRRKAMLFFRFFFTHASMFIHDLGYDSHCAFIQGYDCATGVLDGFDNWLHEKHDTPKNIAWIGSILYLLKPPLPDPFDARGNPEYEKPAIQTLARLLDEFFTTSSN